MILPVMILPVMILPVMILPVMILPVTFPACSALTSAEPRRIMTASGANCKRLFIFFKLLM
jgi:hypothetical protein